MLVLDHIVVAAETLKEGREYVEDLLRVQMQSGGKHAIMGTHNALLGLEDGLYLEVISVDPEVARPDRNRWFGLDDFSGPPRLTNWVGRSDDLVSDMRLAFGKSVLPTELTRGELRWQMSVIDDGQTPFDGIVPMMLDWGQGPKAADRLKPSGCRLKKLVLGHPNHTGVAKVFDRLVDKRLVEVECNETPTITAVLTTPSGQVVLR
ncbi:MAG: VOC family protein [Paracoccaceae bacterium]|nr:VOC family protein [Paracoccaceae bacterium]MDG2256942.1 VOC family protein [Paracoccaceae bacterium]